LEFDQAPLSLDLTAEQCANEFEDACQILKGDRYMDDICFSKPTANECFKTVSQIDQILETGHFQIKEWLSNKPIEGIVNSNEPEQEVVNVLGLRWNRTRDTIFLPISIPKKVRAEDAISVSHHTHTDKKSVLGSSFIHL